MINYHSGLSQSNGCNGEPTYIAGANAVYKIGGPWAIGSMACGTETVPPVDKIVGPGNKYVTAAKLAVFGKVDIDSPAGPSEVLILADDSPEARLVAVDLLAQAEHEPHQAALQVLKEKSRHVRRKGREIHPIALAFEQSVHKYLQEHP